MSFLRFRKTDAATLRRRSEYLLENLKNAEAEICLYEERSEFFEDLQGAFAWVGVEPPQLLARAAPGVRMEVVEYRFPPANAQPMDVEEALRPLNDALRQTPYWKSLLEGTMLVQDLSKADNNQRRAKFTDQQKPFGFGILENGDVVLRLPATMQQGISAIEMTDLVPQIEAQLPKAVRQR